MKCKKESTAQKAYLRRQLHRRRLVLFCRIFLFVFFLICWEMSARLGLIDAFIFSSPSRTVRCFLRMMQDKSILIHTGVTLYETLISFTLVILCGLIGAVLLWSSRNLSEILEPYLVMLNSLPKSALAPILIVWLGSNIRTIIVASGRCLRLDPDTPQRIFLDGSRPDQINPVPRRKPDSYFNQSPAARLNPADSRQHEGQHRSLPSWRHHR